MKHIALSLSVLVLISCGAKPSMVAVSKTYSGDARPADADDCAETDVAIGTTNSSNAGGVKQDTTQADTGAKTPATTTAGTVVKPVVTPNPTPTPTTPVVSVPVTPKPVETSTAADPKLEKIKAMLAAKRLVSEFTVTEANSWGTSANTRIEVMVAVDDKGKALVPKDISDIEAPGNVDASKDGNFGTSSVHSALKICNQSKVEIRLHAQSNLPFEHSMANIRKGACTLYFLSNANAIPDGKSWDHNIGDKLPILFNVVKIKPDGSVFK